MKSVKELENKNISKNEKSRMGIYGFEGEKELGQFFTPIEIVNYILDNSGFRERELIKMDSEKLVNLKIADISVGEGVFLIECFKRLLNVLDKRENIKKVILKKGYKNPEKWIVEHNLYGVDIDKKLVEKTKESLSMLCKENIEDIKFNIFQGNTLLSEIREDIDYNFFEIKFDFLFGNPPYSKKMNQGDKKKYFKLYSESIGGHPNLCTLFIHKSIEMLNKGGVMGYLVSAPYISAYYHRKLRKLIIERTKIIEVLRFEDRKNVVDKVLQELSILILKNEETSKDYKLIVSVTKDRNSLSKKKIHKNKISLLEFLHNTKYNNEFLIAKSLLDYSIVEKMKKKGKPLKNYAKVSTGEVVQFRSKELISNVTSSGSVPLVEIEFIKKFQFSNKFKKWYKPKKDNQYIHNGEEIIVKRMTSKEQPKRIIASVVNKDKYAVDNKLNYIKAKDRFSLYSILGLLNSLLFDYYFRLFSSNTQVSSNELRFLPVMLDEEVGKIAERMQESEGSTSELNEKVFNLYEISSEEKKHILSFYK